MHLGMCLTGLLKTDVSLEKHAKENTHSPWIEESIKNASESKRSRAKQSKCSSQLKGKAGNALRG